MFVIIKDAPMPTRARGGRRGECKYPWASMEVGDAFDVPARGPTKSGKQDLAQNSLTTSARTWAMINGKDAYRVTTYLVDGGKTVRCWRTR